MADATVLEKPVTDAAPKRGRKPASLDGVQAVIYRPELDTTVPSQVGNSPSIRSHVISWLDSILDQHVDLAGNARQTPQFGSIILRPGTNWVSRDDWRKAKEYNRDDETFATRLMQGVFCEMIPTGEARKSLTCYSDSDAVQIAQSTWLKEDVEALMPDETRPIVLTACANQIKRIESQFNIPVA